MHNFKMAQFFIVIFNLNINAIYICTFVLLNSVNLFYLNN